MFNQLSNSVFSRSGPVTLSEIVNDVPVVQLFGPGDAVVAGITTDSRKARDRWLFVAVEGEHADGHRYVQKAVEQGASVVVVQLKQYMDFLKPLLTPSWCRHARTTVMIVENSRRACALLAARFHGLPADKLTMVGITGTNGKTTTAYLISAVLRAAGMKTGMLGTIEYRIGDATFPASLTTPQAEDLHRLFAEMVAAGCVAAVMEVSSHALALGRVDGIAFDASVFTNFTQDHLDFHLTMDAYRDAKRLLFSGHTRGVGIINTDDPAASHMAEALGRKKKTYGKRGRPSFRIADAAASMSGTRCTIEAAGGVAQLASPLAGAFNAYNIAAAYSAARALGIDDATIARGIRSVENVPGRFERIRSDDGVTGIVDYAHTPDALAKAIDAIRALLPRKARLITVFGCGGDRDRGKRRLMGEAASAGSDITIITSDNPRSEKPADIIRDIIPGIVEGATVLIREDRRAAIRRAVSIARPGDAILVAGKGHETYQLVGPRRLRFDDREALRGCFEKVRSGEAS